MKSYVCAILLLMCGVAHCFWTPYDPENPEKIGCIIEGQFLTMGEIREYKCSLMECREDGEIIHQTCPEIKCPPGEDIISISENSRGLFPRCCKIPVCAKF